MSKVVGKEGDYMKFTEHFGLGELNQRKLDFLDGLIEKDVPFYIDPLLIEAQDGDWYTESTRIIRSFFDTIFNLYREGHINEANKLLIHAREPNETRLGVSQGISQGRGTSPERLVEIFDDIRSLGLLDDIINDYKEINLYVEDFAEDRMSDLVTNILRGKLAEYTINQSIIHNLPITENSIEIGMTWDVNTLKWKPVTTKALLINNNLLLLVPKSILVKKYLYTTDNFFSKSIYEWRQNHHVENKTSLSRSVYVKSRNEYVVRPPSQKEIDRIEIIGEGHSKKDYAIYAARKNNQLIDIFTRRIGYAVDGTHSNRLTDEEIANIVEHLQKSD